MIMRTIHSFIFSLLSISLVVVAGCGGRVDAPKYPVSGEVLLDGKPLAEGTVQFVSVAKGFNVGFDVSGGKFEGEAIEGDLKVEVYAYKEGEVDPMYKDDPSAEPSRENYIPDAYNLNSKMKAKVNPDKEGAGNTYKFEVKSK